MKLLILTAILAAVASTPVSPGQTWPWQVGKVYHYSVSSTTMSQFEDGIKNGNMITMKFTISVKAAGHLMAKIESPMYKLIKSEQNPEFQPIQNINQTFDIFVDGGRVVSMDFPSSLSIAHENVIKSFISALQVDVSTFGFVHDYPNSYDQKSKQGLFKKMEFDLSGECETLYSVSPMSAEWRQELPKFASEEELIEIVKTKNYGSCDKRVSYSFGVPEGAVWQGIAQGNDEKQFIKQTSSARTLVGKQGTIYKSEIVSTVAASPFVYGKQKAEVMTIVTVDLQSVEEDNTAEWVKIKDCRTVKSLLFTVDNTWRLFTYGGENNVAKAQQVLQEITPFLQNPSQMEKGNFLMQFNVLVYILMSMNAQQLSHMTSSIEVAKTSKNVEKNGMWIIYRDAVAQCGTPRAYAEIKSWVVTKKIEGEEAAHVITALGAALSPPSKALLTDFFNFATCSEVSGQKAVYSSALLAVSKLLRYSKEDQLIVETVIPYLSKELKTAVDNGETSKAELYVKVLGFLGHPGILKVFAPYLEGQVMVTKYCRTEIVTNLKTLANLRDKYVLPVLYSILVNTAEPYEVRVAAALNIFLAFPTPEMMQEMARMTYNDPSTQVRAVLANSITFAAGLKGRRFAELAKNAQSVMSLISKEKYGYSYSTDSLMDGYTGDDEFSYFRELSFIGSDNTLLPKYHRSALRFKGTAFDDERQVTLSVSNIQYLLDSLLSNFIEPTKSKPAFKFSAEKIIEMLNIKQTPREPLEGSLFVENLGQQKLITFSEDEFYAFIKNIMDNLDQLSKGVDFHFTKILRQNRIYVDIPTASGMPFTYQYTEPMIINAQVESKFTVDDKAATGVTAENKFNLTYARNLVGTVGFMDTIGEVLVATGVINKLQVHIPGKLKTSFKLGGEFKVQYEPLLTDKDINLVHMSVLPYTGTFEKDSLTYQLDVIQRTTKDFVATDFKFGHLTGMYYRFYGHSYSSDYKDKENFKADFLTNLGNLLYQKDIAATEYDFNYLCKEAQAKSVTFTLFYDKLYNQKNSGEMGPSSFTEHLEPNSVPRREELVKKVSTGIEAAEVIVIDMSTVFDGPEKAEYVFTAAYAESFVDPKVQAAFVSIVRQIGQISGAIKINTKEAKIVPINFEEALKNKINVTFEADFSFGKLIDFNFHGYAERSKEYTELLKNSHMGEACLQDVKNQNLYQKDCHKMIVKAHTPDYFKTIVSLKEGDNSFWPLVDNAYKNVQDEYSFKYDVNPFDTTDDNKLIIEAQAHYFDNYESYKITSKYGSVTVGEEETTWADSYSSAIYAPINSWERARNWYTDYQYMPFCTVDDNKVRTFSGRSYDYKLTSAWHVVMVDEANDLSEFDDLVILARRPNDNEEIVYVSYKNDNGKYIELEIKPNNVEVKTDAVRTCEGALTMYWDDSDKHFEAPILEYYTLAEGIQVFYIGDRYLRLVYDHQRLIVFTADHRSTTRGICGQSTGQTSDDYVTPWGIVTQPEYYGASFSLDGEFCDTKTAELKKEAKQKAYLPFTKYTKISSAGWSNIENQTVKTVA